MTEPKIYIVKVVHSDWKNLNKAFFSYDDAFSYMKKFKKDKVDAGIEEYDLNEEDFESTLWCGDERVR